MIMPEPGPAGSLRPISRAFGVRSAAPAGRCEMRPKTDTPRWIAAILSLPWLLPISRAALVSAFLIGGIQKLIDFPAARRGAGTFRPPARLALGRCGHHPAVC